MNFKIAWRNIFKSKFHTFMNIFGLAVSMAFVLLISAYVWQAYQVNAGIKNTDNQYILQSKYKDPSVGIPLTTIGNLPKALREEYPNLVANYYRFDGITCIVSNGDLVFEENASIGDSTLLKMYGFDLLAGDAATALSSPFSVVITEATAMKYFSTLDAVGKNLTIRNFNGETHDFKITGVLKSNQDNSVMQLTSATENPIILPLANQEYFGRQVDSWENPYIVGYVELQPGVKPEQLNAPVQQLLKSNTSETIASNLTPDLKPLKTYHLDDNNGAIRKIIKALMLTASFLLLMAVINFVNSSISQSNYRLKEVGVRKIMGISKSKLIAQLILESILIVGISSLIALVFYPVLSPVFSSIMGKDLPSLTDLPSYFLIYYVGAVLLIGILSGIYPALKLSNIKITQAVKGQFFESQNNHFLKKSLLFFQFSVAIVVLMMSIIISRQVNLFLNGDLGFDKNYLFTVQAPRDWSEQGVQKMETVRQEMLTLPDVENISLSYDVPGAIGTSIQKIKKNNEDQGADVQLIASDNQFADAYKIKLIAGKFFSEATEQNSDVSKIVINKKTAEALGYQNPEDAIGQQVKLFDDEVVATISGVTDNFQANSMHTALPAIAWFDIKLFNQYRYLSIRINSQHPSTSIQQIEKKWKELLPDSPFEIKYMDQTLNKMYATEIQLQNASKIATFISILIVILSIIGLTSITVNQRLKEIGIRRVLGASINSIVRLFSKEFLIVFGISLLVAIPIAYFLMKDWLANYAVKTELNTATFLLPAIGLSLVILLFLSFVIVRATLLNPIKNLRDE